MKKHMDSTYWRLPAQSKDTWRSKARKKSAPVLAIAPRERSSAEKFNIVLEIKSMNEREIGAYFRRKGIFRHMGALKN